MSSKEKSIPEKRDLLFENHARDCRYSGPLKVSPTLTATIGEGGNNGPIILNCKNEKLCENNDIEGNDTIVSTEKYRKTGGNNTPFVAEPIAFGIEATINKTDTAHTLDTANPNPNKSQGGLAIVQESYCIAANTINRKDKNGGNGLGCQSDIERVSGTTHKEI